MKLRAGQDVVFRDLAGEAVLLNLETGKYFGLNEVGTRLWHVMIENGSTPHILQVLLAEYEVEETQLRQDVEALIQQLLSHGLVCIEENEPESPAVD